MSLRYYYDKDLNFPHGFECESVSLGIKKGGEFDTAILISELPACWGGVFTKNVFRSYSIKDALLKKSKRIKLLAVFSGNANTCTGKSSINSVKTITEILVKEFKPYKIEKSQVLTSFTGVIGVPLPIEKLTNALHKQFKVKNKMLSYFPKTVVGNQFYNGILTTDTRPKKIAVEIKLKNSIVRLSACAKGAGMIAPNMATMLSFMTTDLNMTSAECRKQLQLALPTSFNSISIDGDCSTNDSAFLIANGHSMIKFNLLSLPEKEKISKAIRYMYEYLAKEIVKDGEGATKFITIKVSGALNNKIAFRLSQSVGQSLLVKTAMFGNDPNYGRILMALGGAGVRLNLSQVRLKFGNILLYEREHLLQERLKQVTGYLKRNKEILIDIKVGKGTGKHLFYTCDISYDYVKINAEYTT